MSITDDTSDAFLSLLGLEDKFYSEGYRLGEADGDRAGLIEGRLFGLEKGFEKYAAMGQLHGRAVVWAGRLPIASTSSQIAFKNKAMEVDREGLSLMQDSLGARGNQDSKAERLRILSMNPRLENQIRTLYALTEMGSFTTTNTEHAMTDFDDRLKRAQGKVKVIERMTGVISLTESDSVVASYSDKSQKASKLKGDGGIEDLNNLHVRH